MLDAVPGDYRNVATAEGIDPAVGARHRDDVARRRRLQALHPPSLSRPPLVVLLLRTLLLRLVLLLFDQHLALEEVLGC